MRIGVLIICFSIIISGCRNNNKVPPGIIPQKKMQVVLKDMMRADQFLADFVFKKDSGINKSVESIKLYNQLFSIHHISKEQFGKSFSFYKTHPVLFKELMDSISKTKSEAPTEMIKQLPFLDSFQKPSPAAPHPDSIKTLRKKKIAI